MKINTATYTSFSFVSLTYRTSFILFCPVTISGLCTQKALSEIRYHKKDITELVGGA